MQNAEQNRLKITGWPLFYIIASDSTWESIIAVLDSLEIAITQSDLFQKLDSFNGVFDEIAAIRDVINNHWDANDDGAAFATAVKLLKKQSRAMDTNGCIPFHAEYKNWRKLNPGLDKLSVSTFKDCSFYFKGVQRGINDKIAKFIKEIDEYKTQEKAVFSKADSIDQATAPDHEINELCIMMKELTSKKESIKSIVPDVAEDLMRFLSNCKKMVLSLYPNAKVELGTNREKKGFFGRKKIVNCQNLEEELPTKRKNGQTTVK